MNIVTLTINKGNLSCFELHFLEHFITKKIDKYLEKNKIDNEGIIINAETFISYLKIEISFYNKSLLSKVLHILKNIKCELNDVELLKKEFKRIKEEVKFLDLTEEEKVIYSNFKIDGKDIYELYTCPSTIEINKKLLDVFNLSLENSYIHVYSDGEFKNIKKSNFKELHIELNNDLSEGEDFLSYSITRNIYTLKDYFLASLLSFALGRTSFSIVDRYILNPKQLYLGYTMDVFVFRRVIINILTDSEVKKEELFNIVELDINNYLSIEDFIKLKNAFITNFFLNNYPTVFNNQISNICLEKDYNIKDIKRILENISYKDLICFK